MSWQCWQWQTHWNLCSGLVICCGVFFVWRQWLSKLWCKCDAFVYHNLCYHFQLCSVGQQWLCGEGLVTCGGGPSLGLQLYPGTASVAQVSLRFRIDTLLLGSSRLLTHFNKGDFTGVGCFLAGLSPTGSVLMSCVPSTLAPKPLAPLEHRTTVPTERCSSFLAGAFSVHLYT